MKYAALWLGTACALGLIALVLTGGYLMVQAASMNPELLWIPAVVVGILLIATLVAVVEYLTDRKPAETTDLEQ